MQGGVAGAAAVLASPGRQGGQWSHPPAAARASPRRRRAAPRAVPLRAALHRSADGPAGQGPCRAAAGRGASAGAPPARQCAPPPLCCRRLHATLRCAARLPPPRALVPTAYAPTPSNLMKPEAAKKASGGPAGTSLGRAPARVLSRACRSWSGMQHPIGPASLLISQRLQAPGPHLRSRSPHHEQTRELRALFHSPSDHGMRRPYLAG